MERRQAIISREDTAMETAAAETIARVLGPIYLVFGIGLAIAPDRAARLIDDMAASAAHAFTWGFIVLSLGLLVLAFHPGWRADWTALVTLIGWAATIKGALLVLVPEVPLRLARGICAAAGRLRAVAVVPLALGAFLAAVGYGLG